MSWTQAMGSFGSTIGTWLVYLVVGICIILGAVILWNFLRYN